MKAVKTGLLVGGILLGLLLLTLFIGAFIWYANTVIPHTYPTVYTNFWWGLIHGIFIVPTFFWSLFAHSITIYQAPNDGNWYNFGYFIGISIILGGSHGARSKSPKFAK
ncbi:MAG TPA: hypothetical protein VLF79_02235 [Candidatus Saccharimonadales bacterium]|nr:hypothetical protein [Candidatus Saccharimonadales bacterium]